MSKRPAFWLAWFTCALYLVIGGVTLLLQIKDDPSSWLNDLFGALILLAFATVGSLIASRRPQNPIGWLFCISTLLWALGSLLQEYTIYALITDPGSLPSGALAGVIGHLITSIGFFLMLTFGLLLFPNGHLPGPRWRFLAWLIVVLLAAYSIAFLLSPYPYANSAIDPRLAAVRNPMGILLANDLLDQLAGVGALLLFPTVIACIISVVLRFRRVRGIERQQLKWLAYGTTLSTLMLIVIVILEFFTVNGSGWSFYLAVVCIPISAGIAILRYRLYDIDLLINRTLVYGLLTFLVAGVYVLIVVGLGTALQARGNVLLSLVATALVAVLFQPLRLFLQRRVNRLLYGQRDEPYAVISRLGSRLEATLAPDAILPTIVETVAQALKLPYAAILLQHDRVASITASYGVAAEPVLHLPLLYQSEPVGELLLAPRAQGESFTSADHRLLDDLARQVGIAVHAVRLTADLQLSRQRLVRAREEERRRLRRDLHDGLGPTLATITVKAEAARDAIAAEPAQAIILLEELVGQAQTAISDIRRLVYNLRPPALDDLGLVAAIRTQAMHYEHPGLQINTEVPEPLPELPAAAEVAAYRIVQEALTNVIRHANAHSCLIRLAFDGVLHLSVTDDGCGIPVDREAGVGLRSMQERAEELGGSCVIGALSGKGTTVQVNLPCSSDERHAVQELV